MRSLFQRFFPTPEYLRAPSIGLDISDRSIKYVLFSQKDGESVVESFGKIELPPGIVVSGKIADAKGLRDILHGFAAKIKRRVVRVSLPEEQVYLFNVTLPPLKEQEVQSSIALSLEEHVPIPSNNAVFDYDLITSDKDGLHLEVAATSTDITASYMSIFEGTGLVPLSLELEAQALARAVVAKNDTRTHMIIDFGETRTGLSIVSGGAVLFTSTIDIGGHHVNEAIAKYFSISEEEARLRKEKFGLSSDGNGETSMLPAVVGSLSALQDEINKNYVFWHTHPFDDGTQRPHIDTIMLCGGEANIVGIDDYLSQTLHTKVTKANPWVNITDFSHRIPDMTYKESLAYATAFGLALGDSAYD